MPMVAYTRVRDMPRVYHVLYVEGVLSETQNQARFSDRLVAQKHDLKLHLRGKRTAVLHVYHLFKFERD